MKQLHRHTALPTPESMTRAALKKLTHEQILAAKFADEIIRHPRVTNLIAKPEPKPLEPLTFSLGLLIP